MTPALTLISHAVRFVGFILFFYIFGGFLIVPPSMIIGGL